MGAIAQAMTLCDKHFCGAFCVLCTQLEPAAPRGIPIHGAVKTHTSMACLGLQHLPPMLKGCSASEKIVVLPRHSSQAHTLYKLTSHVLSGSASASQAFGGNAVVQCSPLVQGCLPHQLLTICEVGLSHEVCICPCAALVRVARCWKVHICCVQPFSCHQL